MEQNEPDTKVSGTAPQIASSDWQVDVLAQASRLDSQLERADSENPATVSRAQELIARARLIASGKVDVNRFRDWLYGIRVETAWRYLQQAQEELLLVRPRPSSRQRSHPGDD